MAPARTLYTAIVKNEAFLAVDNRRDFGAPRKTRENGQAASRLADAASCTKFIWGKLWIGQTRFSRNCRFACSLRQRLLNSTPGEHGAFDPLRKFSHALEKPKIAQLFRLLRCFARHETLKCAENFRRFSATFSFQFCCHHRRRRPTDGTAMSAELYLL